MKKVLLSIFTMYTGIVSAQMTDLPVSASQTNIVSGQNVQIITTGSQIGYQYALRNNSNNSFVDGPVQGTGGDLIFNTGAITSDQSYNVYGTNGFAASLSFGNDRIDFSNDERSIDQEITVAAWIKTGSSSGLRNIVLDYGANDAGFILRIDANGRVAFSGRDGTSVFKTSGISSTVVTDNQWHYVVGAANLATGEWGILVDGVPENFSNNQPGVSFINTDNLYIGNQFSTSNAYVGQIKEVTIWNRVLDGQEMLVNMNNCLDGSENDVVGHFPLSEGTGNEVVDYSSVGINGTITSGSFPWVGNSTNCRYELEMSQIINVTVGTGTGIFVDSINVTGSGGVSTISTDGGSLQMLADVFPVNADDDTYTWSVIDGTGSATISATGLLTAATDGTVEVVATANDGSGIIGILEVILSNQLSIGIDEVDFNEVLIYPNPVSDQLFIDIEDGQINQIDVIDHTGRIVKTITANHVNSINVTAIETGVYILKVSTEKGISTKKFLKQ